MIGAAEQLTAPPMPRMKPPIGLIPKNIWLSERLYNIKCAIERYTLCNYIIPIEWIKEYNDLVNNIAAAQSNDALNQTEEEVGAYVPTLRKE